MPTPFGGNLMSGWGGFVTVKPLPITGQGLTRIDVAGYKLHRDILSKRCGHSGTTGMVARRHTGLDWYVDCKIWWDAFNPPDIKAKSGYGCQVTLEISNPEQWASIGVVDQTTQHYFSPSGMLTVYDFEDSSEGTEIVVANARIEGNCGIFKMPDEADYLAQIQAYMVLRGWTW